MRKTVYFHGYGNDTGESETSASISKNKFLKENHSIDIIDESIQFVFNGHGRYSCVITLAYLELDKK